MAEKKEQLEEVQPIEFDYDGKHYTLEFNRASAKKAERDLGIDFKSFAPLLEGGNVLENLDLVLMVPDLFYAAFAAHHPRVSRATADEIYELMGDRMELMQRLIILYLQTYTSILETPKNVVTLDWK